MINKIYNEDCLVGIKNIPDNVWSILAGIFLILIGISKFFL